MRAATFVAATCAGVLCASAIGHNQAPLHKPSSVEANGTSPLLALHKNLVEITSTSGSERNASDFLKAYLQRHGFTVETQDVEANRQNVYAYLGSSRSTRVLVTSHIDTVPPYWPYERKGDEIWGRGSVDAKGSVASQIIAVEALIKDDKIAEGDVGLLFVVGEEDSGIGMQTANKLELSWEAVIFGEPTELKLASGHKGGIGFTIRAKGKAGHSGYPDEGRNAIDLLVNGLAALQQLRLPSSREFGETTLNVGRIEGGVAANVIPEDASATAMVRIAAGTPARIMGLIQRAVAEVSYDLSVEFKAGRSPIAIDTDIDGFETIVVSYGTDIGNLQGDHKRYLYGPGTILLAHSDHEHIKIKDLEDAVEGYKALITKNLERSAKPTNV
ncbi:hypothetical protein JX265_013161 [Neoarthrinium moseri]|uniref:Peptidase M20 dimerisation domain-containing protein n=1 Tax=Neoarthrinium moseri TaxID=1658444 RepID=A0A9P9W9C5_9PEZI|nr:hypothetical protein JX265_013161 [Neoarthrinium moseri]